MGIRIYPIFSNNLRMESNQEKKQNQFPEEFPKKMAFPVQFTTRRKTPPLAPDPTTRPGGSGSAFLRFRLETPIETVRMSPDGVPGVCVCVCVCVSTPVPKDTTQCKLNLPGRGPQTNLSVSVEAETAVLSVLDGSLRNPPRGDSYGDSTGSMTGRRLANRLSLVSCRSKWGMDVVHESTSANGIRALCRSSISKCT